jgi:hypothetical protein
MQTILLAALWGTAARAAAPPTIEPTEHPDGGWQFDFVVPAPLSVVRAALADPIAASRFAPDILSVSYIARGACDTLHVETGVTFAPVSYDALRCPTADGFHETLVKSTTLSEYEGIWRLAPEGAGTHVSYHLRVAMAIPAPAFLVAGHMRDSMRIQAGRLYAAVTSGT